MDRDAGHSSVCLGDAYIVKQLRLFHRLRAALGRKATERRRGLVLSPQSVT
jgi:hypothetical protein